MFKREDLSRIQNTARLEAMEWKDFEWFSKYFFEYLGYERTHVTGKHGEFNGDGGVDIEMYKDNEKIYVQCKRWSWGFKGPTLPVHIVRELGGCLLRDGVKKGIVITTLDIDETDRREAQKMNIELIGLSQIVEIMSQLNPEFNKVMKIGFWRKFFRFFGRVLRFFLGRF